jgi:hypothetical protein
MKYRREKEFCFDCVRDKMRYEFHFIHCSIHCTIVNKSFFYIEIEAVNDIRPPSEVVTNMLDCLNCISEVDGEDVTLQASNVIDCIVTSKLIQDALGPSFVMQKPMDLTVEVLKSNPFLQCSDEGYVIVTGKVDGTRAYLVIHGEYIIDYSTHGSVLVGRITPFDMSFNMDGIERLPEYMESITILDCEKTVQGSMITYHVFDVILVEGYKIYTLHYEGRYDHASFVVNRGLITTCCNIRIFMKPYHKYYRHTSLEHTPGLNRFVEQYDNSVYDGLILYHPHQPYSYKSRVSKVFKWKYRPTVDVLIRNNSTYVSKCGSLHKVPYNVHGIPSNSMSGVIECTIDGDRLIYVKYRADKTYPNSIEVFNRLMRDTPLTKDILTGNASEPILMRMVHNQVKTGIIRCQAGRLLDIGSGQGADVSKWHLPKVRLTEVVCLEPRSTRMDELTRRLSKYTNKEPICRVLPIGIDQYDDTASFNHINAFFMLNDIHPDDHMAFFNKCFNLLAKDGTLNITFLDYGRIRQIPSLTSCSYFSIHEEGGISKFSLHGAKFNDDDDVVHTEYSITASDVISRVTDAGFTITTQQYLVTGFMSYAEMLLSSCYMLLVAQR